MNYAGLLIEKYKSKGLLLDSNLLLLHLVGSVDPSLVGTGQYNKLSSFNLQQILILRELISVFNRLVTTAHILAEVSNFVGTLHDAGRQRVYNAFANTLQIFGERQLSSYHVAGRQEFPYLGLTDSVLSELSHEFLIVSNDGRMVDMLRANGSEALKWVEVLGLSV
jgi:hypothetical protein